TRTGDTRLFRSTSDSWAADVTAIKQEMRIRTVQKLLAHAAVRLAVSPPSTTRSHSQPQQVAGYNAGRYHKPPQIGRLHDNAAPVVRDVDGQGSLGLLSLGSLMLQPPNPFVMVVDYLGNGVLYLVQLLIEQVEPVSQAPFNSIYTLF